MFNFKKDDKVLYCVATGKIKRRKLKYIWEGPYIVQTVLDNGNICIVNDDKSFIQIVNGNKLRPYGVNKFTRGDPFVEQVEDILREVESTTEEYWPNVADDYRIELTPKGKGFLPERNSEGEEIPFNQGEKIGNRARRWREAKQAKETLLLETSQYRIEVPPISKNLSKYPRERNPLERPKKGKKRMDDVRRMYKMEASKVFYAWKDYALSLERMRPFSAYNPKGKEMLSNQDLCYGNGLKRSKVARVSKRESLWEKYYYGIGEPSTSRYPDVDLYNISVINMSEEHASDVDTIEENMQHVPINIMNGSRKDINCYSISILREEDQPDDVNVMMGESVPDTHPDGCNSSGINIEGTKKGIITIHDGRIQRQWIEPKDYLKFINHPEIMANTGYHGNG
ncbi:hypothetical protein R1sor_000839 [Riccia sorocarpa]|uniref:Uncharacterized protein n=1 Tax=Riccia sorocarpa TaxID=122646 RepID=A0ABD3GU94_9MARC